MLEKTHCDAFLGTSLHEVLQGMGIERLIIVGMQTDFCVDTTCRRAFSMGYKLLLVSDGHSTYDTKHLTGEQIVAHHNRVLGYIFAELKPTVDVLVELRGQKVCEWYDSFPTEKVRHTANAVENR